MWYHWCWYQCYVMPMLSSIVRLHSLGEGNWNEVQHVFGHVTPLVLASTLCDINSIIYIWHHCTPWVKMIKMRFNMTFLVMWLNNVVYMLIPLYCIYKSSKTKRNRLQLLFPCYKYTCMSNKYDPQMSHTCHICKLLHGHMRKWCQYI